ncbi:MAG TPA: hypothetical protein VMR86_18470 [Myxococcota bacterium]|nr:hypothetical protein [Myxococcota bacterium]
MAKQRGSLERVVAHVPGFRGYVEREHRRQADQLLRDHGAARLERIAGDLRGRISQAALEDMDEARELIACVEKVRGELRFADRGYSGFFEEAKLDDGPGLDALYAQDERIAVQVAELAAQVTAGELSAPLLRGAVKRLGLSLADRRNAILGLRSN